MTKYFLYLLILVSLAAQGQKSSLFTFEEELLKTELDFSTRSKDSGFINANFHYAADSAFVFRPTMLLAKEWARPLIGKDSDYQLTWYPSFIEMSQSGDLGFATGPFEITGKTANDTTKKFGQFLTIWKRQADGTLKFVMDFGSGQLPASAQFHPEPIFKPGNTKTENIITANRDDILNVEKQFIEDCAVSGDIAAYRKYALNDLFFFYQRQFYIHGKDKTLNSIPAKEKHQWECIGLAISKAGDLAYTWGTHKYNEGDLLRNGYYLRIWKKVDDKWMIRAQVRSLLPK